MSGVKTLGKLLKSARTSRRLTLRQVDEKTGYSNGYLSLLENGTIKKPSLDVISGLASFYGVDVNILLDAVNSIKKEAADRVKENKFLETMAFYSNKLTDEQKEEVVDFLKFKFYRAMKKQKSPDD
jgi:transcriptional regulator with XRE-family HTH domain